MKTPERIIHETNFFIFPQDCNYNPPMVFGGKMLSEMDICAAGTVRRAMYDSPVKDALTTYVDKVRFVRGAVIKDMIFMRGEIVKIGIKSITVYVEAFVEVDGGKRDKIAEGTFTFVAYDMKEMKGVPHELSFDIAQENM